MIRCVGVNNEALRLLSEELKVAENLESISLDFHGYFLLKKEERIKGLLQGVLISVTKE